MWCIEVIIPPSDRRGRHVSLTSAVSLVFASCCSYQRLHISPFLPKLLLVREPKNLEIGVNFTAKPKTEKGYISLGMSSRISFFELTNERWVREKFSTNNEELHNPTPIPRTSLGICILSRFLALKRNISQQEMCRCCSEVRRFCPTSICDCTYVIEVIIFNWRGLYVAKQSRCFFAMPMTRN